MERYNRHIILDKVGLKGQEKIQNASVLVIGAGGLGCPVLQYLTAAGIGKIGIIDMDIVTISNLQRQILFGTTSIGKNKAIAAREQLKNLNNEITINAYPEKLTHQNALQYFKEYDIIVDGTDNYATRYLINDASIITNKPLVYGAIYKFEGQVSVFNYQNGASYRCIFPKKPNGAEPNCSEVGVLGVLPGIIGSLQATEVLKIILNIGDVLSGNLLCYHALTNKITKIKFKKNALEIEKIVEGRKTFHLKMDTENCVIEKFEIPVEKAFQLKNTQFIDVREYNEQPKITFKNRVQIPLSELKTNLSKIDITKTNVFFCKSGIRSKQAVLLLEQEEIKNSFSIKNNLQEIINYINHEK